MKRVLLSTLLFILGTFIGSDVNAAETPLSVIDGIKSASKIVVLDISVISGKQVNCQIIDGQGLLIFSEVLDIDIKGLKPFNLSKLEEGEYQFKLTNNKQVVKFDVVVTSKEVSILDKNDVTFKPTINLTEEKSLDFHLLSLGKDVTVELENSLGEILYSRNYKKQNTISKRLNLQEIYRGEYIVKVKVGEEIFYEYLSI